MGSFSFTKADWLHTRVANIQSNAPFKFLIPAVYGGGCIRDRYRDYGDLESKDAAYDMYELVAFWNADMPYGSGTVKDYLVYDGEFNPMKQVDNNTFDNRLIGINIACHAIDVDKLKYPLKLVSARYTGTYETCLGRSYSDPNQGWDVLTWSSWEHGNIYHKRERVPATKATDANVRILNGLPAYMEEFRIFVQAYLELCEADMSSRLTEIGITPNPNINPKDVYNLSIAITEAAWSDEALMQAIIDSCEKQLQEYASDEEVRACHPAAYIIMKYWNVQFA